MPVEVEGTISTFGPQVSSTKPTAPRTKIGTSGRQNEGEKQFEYRNIGTASQGVSTHVPSGFGKQEESMRATAPALKFGNRYVLDHDMGKESRPGPGQYTTTEAIGKQVLSGNATLPNYKIGTGQRWGQYNKVFKDDFQSPAAGNPRPTSGWLGDAPTASFYGKGQRMDIAKGMAGNTPTSAITPGPGTYEGPSALGNQPDSRKSNSVRPRIGTSERDKARRLYVSAAHEKDLYGTHSPAPGVYNPKLQGTSKVIAPASFKFGTGDRFSEIKSGNAARLKVLTPGPGSYVV